MTVSRWEIGTAKLSNYVMAALAEALNCDVTDLFRHPNQPSADALLRDQPEDIKEQAIKLIMAIRK